MISKIKKHRKYPRMTRPQLPENLIFITCANRLGERPFLDTLGYVIEWLMHVVRAILKLAE